MMTTMTISEFLLARIAEDEALAQRAASLGADFIGYDTGDRRPDWRAEAGPYDPSRVLAECEAKRRIVARHGSCDDTSFGNPCDDLRDLAAVYADHPDYDEAWRP